MQETLASRIDAFVMTRNLTALEGLLEHPLQESPFRIVTTPGAFDVGRFGWKAVEISPKEKWPGYIVLSTPLTTQDTGELVFQVENGKLRYIPESDLLGARIQRHQFNLHFLPDKKSVEASDRMTVTITQNAPWIFRMAPAYRVESITDDTGAAVGFRQGGGVVVVDPASPGSRDYHVKYGAVVDLPGFAGSISSTEATLTNDYWYPSIGRLPAPYEISIKAPANWTAVGQGEKVSETVDGNEKVTRYRMDLPVTYYSVSAAPYRMVHRVVEGRTFSFWSLRMRPEEMELQAELFAPVLKFYEKFAPFPFTGYGAVDSEVYGGGALEAYSFATYGGGLPDEDAHEPAHTWWGGIMDNTYLNSMWNESFAVYCEGLYRREVPIGNQSERRRAFVSVGGTEAEYDVQSIEHSGVAFGGVSRELGYGKGALVLQLLEELIGTQSMIRTMHEWIAQHPKGEPADWPEFEKIARKVNPQVDLAGFFDDWLKRPGHAEFSATATYSARHLVIKLAFDGPTFRGPIDFLIDLDNGTRLYSTQILREFRNGVATFSLPVPAKPKQVSVDPWRKWIRKIAPEETPAQLASFDLDDYAYVDPKHKDWANTAVALDRWPIDLQHKVLVGDPDSTPQMSDLCRKAGFEVRGDLLTWKGTTISLSKGRALAVIDLPDGKQCVIALGKSRIKPHTGQARTVLTDEFGRFLRGDTDPKTKGNLVIEIP